MHPRSYTDETEGLIQGPRNKLEQTKNLEFIVKAFLNNKPAKAYVNQLDELELIVDGRRFNLTLLLSTEPKPDFEQLELSDEEIARYTTFLQSPDIGMKPELELGKGFPSEAAYRERDPHGNQAHLAYGEKLACSIYFGEAGATINEFLREFGKVESIFNLPQEKIIEQVQEIILVAAIASHGITKIPHNASKASGLLFRAETTCDVDETRVADIQDNKLTVHAGFTSTSKDPAKLKTMLKEKLAEMKKTDGTFLYYKQPTAINPLGKHMEELSPHSGEKEVVFPPNTQFRYLRETKKHYHIFEGIPVRAVPVVNTNYSAQEIAIRSELLLVLNGLKENLDKIEINDLLQLKFITNAQIQTEALRKPVIELIDLLIFEVILVEQNRDLISTSDYAYAEHLSKPFQDALRFPNDPNYQRDAVYEDPANHIKIHRPNHGLPHSLRVALFLPAIIDYFKQFAKDPEFKTFCQNLSAEQIQKMQEALLFFVTGRESEADLFINSSTYRDYKNAAYRNYVTYAKKKLGKKEEDDEIKQFEKIISGDPKLYRGKARNPAELFMFYVMIAAHNFDLMRCYTLPEFSEAIKEYHEEWVTQSPEQKSAFETLLKFVTESIYQNGDRLFVRFSNGQLEESPIDYDPIRFEACSKDSRNCMHFVAEQIFRFYPPDVNLAPYTDKPVMHTETPWWLELVAKQGCVELIATFIHKLQPKELTYLLAEAIIVDQAPMVKYLIDNGADVNVQNSEGKSPLEIALEYRSLKAFRVLLEENANPNFMTSTSLQTTFLHAVVETSNIDMLIELLKYQVDINAQDVFGASPLHVAVDSHQIEMVKQLLAAGADIFHEDLDGNTPIQMALSSNDERLVAALVNVDNYNAVIAKITTNTDKWTLQIQLLKFALLSSDLTSITALTGVIDLNDMAERVSRDHDYKNILLLAAAYTGNVKIADVLLKKNADIFFSLKEDKDVCCMAILGEQIEFLKYLVQKNKDITDFKENLLEEAILYKKTTVIRALIEMIVEEDKMFLEDKVELLRVAIDLHDTETVRYLLSDPISRVNPNLVFHYMYPLSAAINSNQFDMVKLLIECGANMHLLSQQALSALHIAIDFKAGIDIIEYLLQQGADPNVKCNNRRPLDVAIKARNIPAIKLLVQYKATVPQDVLSNLITAGDEAILNALISDTNYKEIIAGIPSADKQVLQALFMYFSKTNNVPAIAALLAKGMDVNERQSSRTPLMIAIQSGAQVAAEFLMESKADIHAIDDHNDSAIHFAAKHGLVKIMSVLLERGAAVASLSKKLDSPLHYAAENGHIDCVLILLNNGADVTLMNKNGKSPLDAALEHQRYDVASILLPSLLQACKGIVTRSLAEQLIGCAKDDNHWKLIMELLITAQKIDSTIFKDLRFYAHVILEQFFAVANAIPDVNERKLYVQNALSSALFDDFLNMCSQDRKNLTFFGNSKMIADKDNNNINLRQLILDKYFEPSPKRP